MDLLGKKPELELNDEEWRIYSRHYASSPQYVGSEAVIDNSLIIEGCEIEGTVKNSVIGSGVKIGRGATVIDSVIMEDAVIEEGATVVYSIVDSETVIGKGATVGEDRATASGIAVLGRGVRVADGDKIAAGAMVSVD